METTVQATNARVVTWELTRACKLSCVHCPVGSVHRPSPVELSTYEAYKTIDQIVALQPEQIVFTGGDPLERTDIYQLIDYARRRELKVGLMASSTPNLTGAAVGKLKRNGLSHIVVSLEASEPGRHDAVRGLTGQFSATLLAIRWARMANLAIEVNTLITKKNMSGLDSLAGLLTELGVTRWNVYFPVPIGEAKTIDMPSPADTAQVLDKLEAIESRVAFAIRTFEAPQYSLIDRAETIFISHTGEVSISQFLPLTTGNVRYLPLTSIYRSSDMFVALRDGQNLKGKCARCEYRRACGGSRARAFAMTNDLFAADPLCNYRPDPVVVTAPPAVVLRGSA